MGAGRSSTRCTWSSPRRRTDGNAMVAFLSRGRTNLEYWVYPEVDHGFRAPDPNDPGKTISIRRNLGACLGVGRGRTLKAAYVMKLIASARCRPNPAPAPEYHKAPQAQLAGLSAVCAFAGPAKLPRPSRSPYLRSTGAIPPGPLSSPFSLPGQRSASATPGCCCTVWGAALDGRTVSSCRRAFSDAVRAFSAARLNELLDFIVQQMKIYPKSIRRYLQLLLGM